MDACTADQLGAECAHLIGAGRLDEAEARLAPVLAARTPFRYLDRIGSAVGVGPRAPVDAFLDRIAAGAAEGGWPIIGSALGQRLESDLPGALRRCRHFISVANVWYGADILGERVPGPALVHRFDEVLPLLRPWCVDADGWVRRSTGVAVHFWAKRSRGAPELADRAQALLDLLDPMFEEREIDAVKGIGWGLKTLGRYYPDLVSAWLHEQVSVYRRPHRAILVRKAVTYL
ncbi:MAG: DNA alkylation repair protein [Anaerolineae bacterium]|nr:DNA alkylation repair protein [Anaerolineae bacterium]